MKFFTYFFLFLFLFLFLFNNIHSSVSRCSLHEGEINHIRTIAYNSLLEAHSLTGDIIGSLFVTPQNLAWDAVKNNHSYMEFCSTFQNGISYCNSKGKFLASNRLYKGFSDVGNLFLDIYDNCILNHQNYHSVFERGKIYFDKGQIESSLADMSEVINAGLTEDILKNIKSNDLLITKAQANIEIGDYENAIEDLTIAINKDPKNKEAYFHRAAAYFETGNFDEALKDYLLSDKGKGISKSTFVATKEFKEALLNNLCLGVEEAAIDFLPSLCTSAYGLGETLWAVHPLNQHSLDNTTHFVNACYEMGECVADYCKNVDWEMVEGCVEQIKALYERFDNLNESEKGELIGFAIGKYGVDILAGGAAFKAFSTYRKLRNANRLCNLEVMTVSNANKETVIASSMKHSAEREGFFRNIKIEWDKQNKHVIGKHNYEPGKSILNHQDPESLIAKYAGKGKPMNKEFPGNPNYRELIDFDEPIGIWKDKEGSLSLPTTKGHIHYSKKGAHIIPAHPKSK